MIYADENNANESHADKNDEKNNSKAYGKMAT
jgi:hypothetical protein